MRTVRGLVVQIIKPEDQHRYLLPRNRLGKAIKGKYIIIVEKSDIPQGIWSTFWFKLTHSTQDAYYHIITTYCQYEVGETIETTIEPLMVDSGYYTNESSVF